MTFLLEPALEQRRQQAVRSYGLAWPVRRLSAELAELTALSERACRLFGADAAAVTILDDDRQNLIATSARAEPGLINRAESLCQQLFVAAVTADVLLRADATTDPVLAGTPAVLGPSPRVRFYCAAPLIDRDQFMLGTLCVWSAHVITPTSHQLKGLAVIADAVMIVLERARQGTEAQHGRPVAPRSPPGRTAGPAQEWTIDRVISERAVTTVFQPVIHLASGEVVGFEAFARGPADSPFQLPMAMLTAAARIGRLGELDWVFRASAVAAVHESDQHPDLAWLMNVEAAGVNLPRPAHLLGDWAKARQGQRRFIVEIVERELATHLTELLHGADQARRNGWGIAFDDVGADDSSLALLPLFAPDVVKLDMSLVRAAPAAESARITAAVRGYAERSGAVILAEGIETAEQERRAVAFGATYGQGYRYSRPGPLPDRRPGPRFAIPIRQQPAQLDGRTPFDTLRDLLGPAGRSAKRELLHISEHLEQHSAGAAAVLLAAFQDPRYFSAAKQRRFNLYARQNAYTMVLGGGPRREDAGYHARELPPDRRMNREWAVIVLAPQLSGAFVARDRGDLGPDLDRQFDFYYTHDQAAVVAAARAFLQG